MVRAKTILYYGCVFAYNIYFHPLAKFPGPKFAAATKIPIAVASWKGDLTHWLKDLHEEYKSDVVRTSPDELSFIGPAAWKDLYGLRPGHPNIQKDPILHVGVEGIIFCNDADHSRQRRAMSHAFSEKALREQEHLLKSHINILIDHCRAQAKNESKVNLSDWFKYLTFDIIGDLSFGESFDCLKNSDYHPYISCMMGALKFIAFQSATMRFPPIDVLLTSLTRIYIPESIKKAKETLFGIARDKLDRRLAKETTRPDFLSYILKHNDEKGMTDREILQNAVNFIGAGSETTANLVCAATYLLLTHPACLETIRSELQEAFRTKEDINTLDLAKLPYFQAVVDESLRIYPPALAGQARRMYPQGDTVSGYWVPGHTGIQLNVYAASHSTMNFRDPEKFVPERWLGDERYQNDRRDVLQPFSIGARNCIGKKYVAFHHPAPLPSGVTFQRHSACLAMLSMSFLLFVTLIRRLFNVHSSST